MAVDPVEKKPLYHFFPGHSILSIGSYGCNMRCDFCQNWHISQKRNADFVKNTSKGEIVARALSSADNIGIAFTYNEPVIWYEYIRDVALMIKEHGLHTVIVSNGYVNSFPLSEITGFIDAFNIDLKSFNPDFYRKLTGAEIDPVMNALKQIIKAGRHLEITTLIIPGRNDGMEEMDNEARWIAGELGKEVPLHLSRYFPTYKRDDPATPVSTLLKLYETAKKHLAYVYLGNTSSDTGQDTLCSNCGTIVAKRTGYSTRLVNLDSEGRCIRCGNTVYGFFTLFPSRGS